MKRIIQKRKMSKFGPLFQKAAVLFHDFETLKQSGLCELYDGKMHVIF